MRTITCLIHEDREYPNKCIACNLIIISSLTGPADLWYAPNYDGFLCDYCGNSIRDGLIKVTAHYKRYRATRAIKNIIQQVTFHSGSQPYFLRVGHNCIIQMTYNSQFIHVFNLEEQSIVMFKINHPNLRKNLKLVKSSPPDFKVSSIIKWLEEENGNHNNI